MIRAFFKTLIVLAILAGCDCAQLPSQHSRIAAACEGSASAAQAIAAARVAGRISQAQSAKALELYRSTVVYCEPPAESLNAVEYAGLLQAAADLAAQAQGKP